nr:PREDICTED: uncharacterized protein LOC100874798 [Megachile rotundata]
MQPMYQLFGSAIAMFVNIAILLYVCQRFLAATRSRRKMMTEMEELTTIVRQARDNVQYIGEQVARGMDEIKDDVGKELRVTDRLTTQNTKLAAVLQRFATLEENVIELVRMDRNRESVKIETPMDVSEEIKKIVAAVERRKIEEEEQDPEDGVEWSKESKRSSKAEIGSVNRTTRNPLSKFSACTPRETVTRKTTDRARISTMPEVRLLGEKR